MDILGWLVILPFVVIYGFVLYVSYRNHSFNRLRKTFRDFTLLTLAIILFFWYLD